MDDKVYEDRPKKIYRGEVWVAELPHNKSCIQGGCRPVLVISNNACNKYSSVVTVVPVTTKSNKRKDLPTHVDIISDMDEINTILCEQILTVDRNNIRKLLYKLDENKMSQVEECLKIQLGMTILRREEKNEVQVKRAI